MHGMQLMKKNATKMQRIERFHTDSFVWETKIEKKTIEKTKHILAFERQLRVVAVVLVVTLTLCTNDIYILAVTFTYY